MIRPLGDLYTGVGAPPLKKKTPDFFRAGTDRIIKGRPLTRGKPLPHASALTLVQHSASLYGLDELACRFDRSVSWVSRRLALVEVLPETIQQQVREGKILAQVALKFLVPVARQSLEDCQRMAAIFMQHHCDTREAGLLYAAWRQASPAIRKRILAEPELFFKVQRQAQEKLPCAPGAELLRDLEMVAAMWGLRIADRGARPDHTRWSSDGGAPMLGRRLAWLNEKLMEAIRFIPDVFAAPEARYGQYHGFV
jgi:hypothetical protein